MTRILAIESSCDETAAAVVEDGRRVLSNVISSQIDLHTVYGGVVPEIASRKHLENIDGVIASALSRAGLNLRQMDAIAVTKGPGLVGALLVGVSEAKAIAYAADLPLIGVNHILGHIAANYLSDPEWEPPFLCLVVSGGHTHLVHVRDYREYTVLGRTSDDAAGEAFDKVARAIGLGYPGGPKIDRVAREGDPWAIPFPRPRLEEEGYQFSFSGLKSAVLNYLNQTAMKGESFVQADVAASFQQAVVDVLADKTMRAAQNLGIRKIALAGGVSANSRIRERFREECAKRGYALQIPEPVFCTDNAAMIGCAAYYQYLAGNYADLSLNAYPGLSLTDG